MSRRRHVPEIWIRLPLEGQAEILRTPGDHWERLSFWLLQDRRLYRIVEAAAIAMEPRVREGQGERVDRDEHDDDDADTPAFAFVFRSYEDWPQLSPKDLVPVAVDWLRTRGVEVDDDGRVVGWQGYEYDEGTEIDEAAYRPSELWPPSMREIEERG